MQLWEQILLHSLSQNRLEMEQRFLYKSYFVFCILMRPANSFLKSKNFQLFVKKKFSLLYPDRGIVPRSRYIPRLAPFSSQRWLHWVWNVTPHCNLVSKTSPNLFLETHGVFYMLFFTVVSQAPVKSFALGSQTGKTAVRTVNRVVGSGTIKPFCTLFWCLLTCIINCRWERNIS